MARLDFVEIDVHGLKEVVEALKKIPEKFRDVALEVALREGAKPIETAMIAKAPVRRTNLNRKPPPGNLKKSISVRKLSRGGGVIRIGVGPNPAKVSPKNKPIWAEYGTGASKGKNRRPFMRPAYDENKEQAVRRVADSLKSQLSKIVSKGLK